jgi:acyl dehydratase
MSTIFNSVATVLNAVGQDLGVTDYISIDQKRIDTFADATGDHQWIHVDPVKAKDGPFGATVAHGYLTLSLANLFLPQLVNYENLSMGVNYGTDKVRFPAPVKVNSRVRGKGEVVAAEEIKGGGVQVVVRISVEVEGQDKPGCVVDTISRLYFA